VREDPQRGVVCVENIANPAVAPSSKACVTAAYRLGLILAGVMLT
jgi:hypothetical protein